MGFALLCMYSFIILRIMLSWLSCELPVAQGKLADSDSSRFYFLLSSSSVEARLSGKKKRKKRTKKWVGDLCGSVLVFFVWVNSCLYIS